MGNILAWFTQTSMIILAMVFVIDSAITGIAIAIGDPVRLNVLQAWLHHESQATPCVSMIWRACCDTAAPTPLPNPCHPLSVPEDTTCGSGVCAACCMSFITNATECDMCVSQQCPATTTAAPLTTTAAPPTAAPTAVSNSTASHSSGRWTSSNIQLPA